jgi:hypothetical protein
MLVLIFDHMNYLMAFIYFFVLPIVFFATIGLMGRSMIFSLGQIILGYFYIDTLISFPIELWLKIALFIIFIFLNASAYSSGEKRIQLEASSSHTDFMIKQASGKKLQEASGMISTGIVIGIIKYFITS